MKGDKGFGLQATLDHLERIRTVATMEHMSIDVTQRTIDIYINGKPPFQTSRGAYLTSSATKRASIAKRGCCRRSTI
jgi:hypothetical protein